MKKKEKKIVETEEFEEEQIAEDKFSEFEKEAMKQYNLSASDMARYKKWKENQKFKNFRKEYDIMKEEDKIMVALLLKRVGIGVGEALVGVLISMVSGHFASKGRQHCTEGVGQAVRYGKNKFKDRE